MGEMIRIVIADDHPLFRRGLATLLSGEPDMEIVGQAGTGLEAVQVPLETQADLVLMDLQMPDGGGVQAIRQLAAREPGLRILVVSLFEDADSVFLAMRAGAHGYVLKDASEVELLRAIRGVADGEVIFSQAIARQVLAWFAATGRHRQRLADVESSRA